MKHHCLLPALSAILCWASLTLSSGIRVALAPSLLQQQVQALSALAQAFPVKETATWSTSNPCSAWVGVTCDPNGAVVSLSLSLGELLQPASIPSDIGVLTALKALQLNGGVKGSLPAALSSLSNLQTLDLTGNQISGPFLPQLIAPLASLTTLALGFNQLSGPLPSSLPWNKTLVHLLLGSNQFSGTVPNIFKPLRSLMALDLSNNQLFGFVPTSLVAIPNLAVLDISNNQLSGPAPLTFQSERIGSASQGTYRISGNFFSGSPAPSASGNFFCPVMQAGAYAATYLAQYRVAQMSSAGGNCLYGRPSSGSDWWSQYSFSSYASSGNQANQTAKSWGSRRRNRPGWANNSTSSSGSKDGGGTYGSGCYGGNVGDNDSPYACYTEVQKTPQLCLAFCNALDPRGPCAGLGTCYPSPSTFQPLCICNSSWSTWPPSSVAQGVTDPVIRQIVPNYSSCTMDITKVVPGPNISYTQPSGKYSFGLSAFQLPAVPSISAPKSATRTAKRRMAAVSGPLNPYFRYASVGFTGTYTSPTWAVSVAADWRKALGGTANFVQGVKDQGGCAACWAFAPVAALESALAIAYSAIAPNISDEQVVDCQGSWSCGGGVPNDALSYMVTSRLTSSASYPYSAGTGVPGVCQTVTFSTTLRTAGAPPPPPYFAQMYEQTTLGGWFGILLAVQMQPVVASVEADQPSFLIFPGGSVYTDASCFANQIINHNVLVVGYNLAAPVPYWTIKNSWGTNWGDAGYMNLAIGGGAGICGINYTPGLYPVVRGTNPCAPFNPCGGGICSVSPTNSMLNICTCPANFMTVNNVDGTQSCAPIRVCALFASNPCGVGSCVDDGAGGYNCLCPPPSFIPGTLSSGGPTCILGQPNNTIVASAGMTCDMIRIIAGLSKAAFISLNPRINCSALPSGAAVNITNKGYLGCQSYYPISKDDTCTSIGTMFGINVTGLALNNPDLDCNNLVQGMQVCVQAGSPVPYMCTQFYSVSPGDTCTSIAQTIAIPPLSPQLFFSYNPGILCSNLIPTPSNSSTTGISSITTISSSYASLFGTQVCVNAVPLNVTTGLAGTTKCAYGFYYTLPSDTCMRIWVRVYCSKPRLFLKYNGFVCAQTYLHMGRVLCRPPTNPICF